MYRTPNCRTTDPGFSNVRRHDPLPALSAPRAAFGGLTFKAMFEWVKAKGYEGNEHFQKYVIKKMNKRRKQ